jgi:hypothetical protein
VHLGEAQDIGRGLEIEIAQKEQKIWLDLKRNSQ